MQVIPILDLKGGFCVHAHQPTDDEPKVTIKENAFEVAQRWIDAGATCLHLSDIDAFRTGEPENVHLVRQIKQQFPHIRCQIAGGVKHEDHVSIWLDTGIDQVVVGSRTFKDPDYLEGMCTEFPNKIYLSIELKDGLWTYQPLSDHYGNTLPELAANLAKEGLSGLICTNKTTHTEISQFQFIDQLTSDIDMPIIINGGLFGLNDVKKLKEMKSRSVNGIIVGKVLYQYIIDFKKLSESIK